MKSYTLNVGLEEGTACSCCPARAISISFKELPAWFPICNLEFWNPKICGKNDSARSRDLEILTSWLLATDSETYSSGTTGNSWNTDLRMAPSRATTLPHIWAKG